MSDTKNIDMSEIKNSILSFLNNMEISFLKFANAMYGDYSHDYIDIDGWENDGGKIK